MVFVPEGQHDRSQARSASAVWTFSGASSKAPDGRTENSPGLQPWERHAHGNRPARASEWRLLQFINVLLYVMAQSPFAPDCPRCLLDKNSAGAPAC